MELEIVTTISAQELLNGPGFNEEYMLEKAVRELERVRSSRDPVVIYDHFINFSVTVASIADWTFHLRLAGGPKWVKKTEIHFCNWIRSQSPEVAAFIDISNECKHANRKHPNFIVENVFLRPIWDVSAVPAEQMNTYVKKGFGVTLSGGKTLFLIPTIGYDSKEEYFFDVAEAALAWWKALDPSVAVPMDKHLAPLS